METRHFVAAEVALHCLLLVVSCKADVETVGNVINPGLYTSTSGTSTWIEGDAALPDATLVRWRIFSTYAHKPVRLQVWRPVGVGPAGSLEDGAGSRFRLVAEHRVIPTSIGLHEYDLSEEGRVRLESGDRLGFTDEAAVGPVAFTVTQARTGVRRRLTPSGDEAALPRVGETYEFDGEPHRRRYSINVDVVKCGLLWKAVNVYCIRFVPTPAPWADAAAHCARLDGRLISSFNMRLRRALEQLMYFQGFAEVWLNNKASVADGSVAPPAGPEAPSGGSSCSALSLSDSFVRKRCTESLPFICQADESNMGPKLTISATAQLTPEPTGAPANATEDGGSSSSSGGSRGASSPGATNCTFGDDNSTKPNCSSSLVESEAPGEENKTLEELAESLDALQENVSSPLRALNGALESLELSLSDWRSNVTVNQTTEFVHTVLTAVDRATAGNGSYSEAALLRTATRVEGLLSALLSVTEPQQLDTTISTGNIEGAIQTASIPRSDGFLLNDVQLNGVTMAFSSASRVTHVTRSPDPGLRITVLNIRYDFHDAIEADRNSTSYLNSKVSTIKIVSALPLDYAYFTLENRRMLNQSAFSSQCVYWNTTSSEWRPDGCTTVRQNETHTTCLCRHLSNFAVLMQVLPHQASRDQQIVLSILTYIGCGLSSFGAFATIVFHIIAKCFTERGRILMNLSLALCAAHVTFILGIDVTHDQTLCLAVAIALHYLWLAVFFWMFAQGMELIRKTKFVFSRGSKIFYYCILGWGFPGIIVGVTTALRLEDYATEKYCWLSMRTGLIWSFVGPVVAITTVNFFVLVSVLCAVRDRGGAVGGGSGCGGGGGGGTAGRAARVQSAARATLMLTPVLGLTWTAGVFTVDHAASAVFQYVFAGVNSLQGFIIFLLHCVFNEEVRHSWTRRLGGGGGGGSRGDSSSSGPQPSSSSSSYGASAYNINANFHAQSCYEEEEEAAAGGVSSGLCGCLIPGHSKRVAITDPRVQKQNRANRAKEKNKHPY